MPPCGELIAFLVPVGEPETGLWCDRCLLPSGMAQAFTVEVAGRPHGVLRAAACTDCGIRLDACQRRS